MSDALDAPLSNTPEHLNRMTDTAKLRLGALLKAEKNHKADGSSRIIDLHALRAGISTEMFQDEWAPQIMDDALVTRTAEELQAEKAAADAREHARLLEVAERKSRRFLKLFFVACGVCVLVLAVVAVVLVRRS